MVEVRTLSVVIYFLWFKYFAETVMFPQILYLAILYESFTCYMHIDMQLWR